MKVLDRGRFGLVCTVAALVVGGAVTGCGQQIQGAATPNAADVTAYQAWASSSSAAATSSQIAATSSRIAAARDKAISDNCTAFPATSQNGVARYNEFVDAHDNNAPDYDARRDTAVKAMEDAANTVQTGIDAAGADLPDDLRAKFVAYVDAARGLAQATREMTYTSPVGPLNDASTRVNDARTAVREACPH